MMDMLHPKSQHEETSRWLITYADMVTLLMAFFIMLYAISQLDLQKFNAMSGSVRAQLGGTRHAGPGEGGAPSDLGFLGSQLTEGVGCRASLAAWRRLRESLRALAKQMLDMQFREEGQDMIVDLEAGSLFAPGRADLLRGKHRALIDLAELLQQASYPVRIEGHTCDKLPPGSPYHSNWELSADRARSIALYFVRRGVLQPERLSCMGYGASRPLVPNSCDANRRRNDRIEVRIRRPAPTAATVGLATPRQLARQLCVPSPRADAPRPASR